MLCDGGDPHREFCLVCMLDGIGDIQLLACRSKASSILGRCVYWDVEYGGRLYHLLGGENAVGVSDASPSDP